MTLSPTAASRSPPRWPREAAALSPPKGLSSLSASCCAWPQVSNGKQPVLALSRSRLATQVKLAGVGQCLGGRAAPTPGLSDVLEVTPGTA